MTLLEVAVPLLFLFMACAFIIVLVAAVSRP